MKYNLILLMIGLLTWAIPTSAQQSDTIQTNYPDGRPAVWYTTQGGKATGEWLEWYPDGTLRFRAAWKNGKGHGLWEYFHANGQLRSELVYHEDIPQGLEFEYYDNGELYRKTPYLNGRKHGPQTWFKPTGEVDRIDYYLGGELRVRTPRVYAPGKLSDPFADEYGIAFGPQMKTAYLTRRYPGEKQGIYLSNFSNGDWSDPIIAPFSINRDEGATVSKDGKTLVFASYRSTGKPKDEEALMDMNLWVTRQSGDEWSVPVPLPGKVNKERPAGTPWAKGYETGPFLAGDKLYYWSAGATGNDPDLMVALRQPGGAYGEGREVGELNTEGAESGATVSVDGKYLVFSAYGREDGFGGEDLYLSQWDNGKWSTPRNLGPVINTNLEEGAASFSPDGKYLFFTRGGEQTQTDIFQVSIAYLPGMR